MFLKKVMYHNYDSFYTFCVSFNLLVFLFFSYCLSLLFMLVNIYCHVLRVLLNFFISILDSLSIWLNFLQAILIFWLSLSFEFVFELILNIIIDIALAAFILSLLSLLILWSKLLLSIDSIHVFAIINCQCTAANATNTVIFCPFLNDQIILLNQYLWHTHSNCSKSLVQSWVYLFRLEIVKNNLQLSLRLLASFHQPDLLDISS